MNYIKRFEEISLLNSQDKYELSNKHTNVVFIGSCRGIVLAIYLEYICKVIPYFINWQIGISVIAVHITQQHFSLPTNNMKKTIENADIIICECIKNYDYINTLKECSNNIFKTFQIKPTTKIIMIPNLSIFYYVNDIKYSNNNATISKNDIISTKKSNLDKLLYWCKYYNYIELYNFIKLNIDKKRLFFTHNNPTSLLSCILFNELIKKEFNYNLDSKTLFYLSLIKILDNSRSDKTLLVELDYELGVSRNVT